MIKLRLLNLALLATLAIGSLSSCTSSKEPKRKKVVGPDGGGEYSTLPWNRPRSWEGNARYGNMMPMSR